MKRRKFTYDISNLFKMSDDLALPQLTVNHTRFNVALLVWPPAAADCALLNKFFRRL